MNHIIAITSLIPRGPLGPVNGASSTGSGMLNFCSAKENSSNAGTNF